LVAVNTKELVLTVPSVVSLELTGMVTLAVGADLNTTVKLTDPPVSVVVAEGVGEETCIPVFERTSS
jgi:hypothetical protein